MFTVRILCDTDKDMLIAELYDAGTLGIHEEDPYLTAWFELAETAARFGTAAAAPLQDWSTAWRAGWHPRLVGQRFYLTPAWINDPTPPGRIRLEYQAGMACGTGEHPGTRLALMGLEAAVRRGDTVLDVGCGSGILCGATQLLGAHAMGCDLEENDLRVAQEHLPADYFAGSVSAVRSRSVDVVVANIDAPSLLPLIDDLRRVARRAVILSGFQPESLRQLPSGQLFSLEGWSALWLQTGEG